MSRRGLEFRLLGPFEARVDGRPVAVQGAKPRALLAGLLLQDGQVVSTDRLIEDLWGDGAPRTAGHALQVYVSQLRKALDPELIAGSPAGYAIAVEPERVDARRFALLAGAGRAELRAGDPAAAAATLREALGLWRGPALADFTYEPFAQHEIARLEELRSGTLGDRLDADLALGLDAELVGELESLVAAEPYRERLRGQLMLALYRSGRQADALAAFRAGREVLVDELGMEPGPQLRELEAAILRQDPALLAPGPQDAPAAETRRLVAILCAEAVAPAEPEPETLHLATRRALKLVAAAVARHGGTVETLAGDSVLAVFGVPAAHEDDALRAARAALEIRAGVQGLDLRLGIECGEVVAAGPQVTGRAVGLARRLAEAADPGQIVLGEAAHRLLAHAGRAESLGAIPLRGERDPAPAFELLEMSATAPAVERRLDASIVDRTAELAALVAAFERASGSAVLVVGPAGIGKSRLVGELARALAGRATILAAGCLPYGEDITYWPLRAIVGQAAGDLEPASIAAVLDDAAAADVLARALGATGPPPGADEIAWAFRRFCSALAERQPLVLVLDDLHWASPTLLDLVEQLAARSTGRLLTVCLARDELLEERPALLDGRETIELTVLAPGEMEELIDRLSGDSPLPAESRARLVEAADGNPLFLEQLLAFAADEGGLDPGRRPVPPTIQALLAARLDRLGRGERAVLARASVVGQEFGRDAVAALLEPDVPALDRHLQALVARGFVRPAEGGFRFRHVLVQEAAYRALPKRERAALHTAFASWLESGPGAQDEIVGYHLEQAVRLSEQLGRFDEELLRTAARAGERLGRAGLRASQRDDTPAAISLLDRATSLLAADDPGRPVLLCELGVVLRAAGETAGAERVLEEAAAAGDRATGLRVQIELASVRLFTDPEGRGDELLRLTETAIPVFEELGDDRSLGRAWMLAGYVHGGLHCQIAAWQEAAERALGPYRRSGWSSSTCIGAIAAALYHGPTPVPEAIVRCEELRRDPGCDRGGEAGVLALQGALEAQRGRMDEGRALLARARIGYRELGRTVALASFCEPLAGEIERAAGEPAAAEAILRESCDVLERLQEHTILATQAAALADVIYVQGRGEEAERWSRLSEQHAASDDLSAQILWRAVRAKVLASQGERAEAEELARDAVHLAERSDAPNQHAEALLALAEVLRLDSRPAESATAVAAARRLYELKGNVTAAARI